MTLNSIQKGFTKVGLEDRREPMNVYGVSEMTSA